MNITLYGTIGTFIKNNNVKYYPSNHFLIALDDYKKAEFNYTARGNYPYTIRVELSRDEILEDKIDYLAVEVDGKTYYHFITNITYINDNVTQLGLQLDTLNSFNFTIKSGQIIQAHRDRYFKDANNNYQPILRSNTSSYTFTEKTKTIIVETIKDLEYKGNGTLGTNDNLNGWPLITLPAPTGSYENAGYVLVNIRQTTSLNLEPKVFTLDPDVIHAIPTWYGYEEAETIKFYPQRLFTYSGTKSIDMIPYLPMRVINLSNAGLALNTLTSVVIDKPEVDDIEYYAMVDFGNDNDSFGNYRLYTIDVNAFLIASGYFGIYNLDNINSITNYTDPNLFNNLELKVGRKDSNIKLNLWNYDSHISLYYAVSRNFNKTITLRACSKYYANENDQKYYFNPNDAIVVYDNPITLALGTDAYLAYQRDNSNFGEVSRSLFNGINNMANLISAGMKGNIIGGVKSATAGAQQAYQQKDEIENLKGQGVVAKSYNNFSTTKESFNFFFYLQHEQPNAKELASLKFELLRYGYSLSVYDEDIASFSATSGTIKEERLYYTYLRVIDSFISDSNCDNVEDVKAIQAHLNIGVTFMRVVPEDINAYVLSTSFTNVNNRERSLYND